MNIDCESPQDYAGIPIHHVAGLPDDELWAVGGRNTGKLDWMTFIVAVELRRGGTVTASFDTTWGAAEFLDRLERLREAGDYTFTGSIDIHLTHNTRSSACRDST